MLKTSKIITVSILAAIAIVSSIGILYFEDTSSDVLVNNDYGSTINKSEQKDFVFAFYSEVAKENKNSNLFFSPLSILTAFSMAYEGAKENTASEMQQVFGFESNDTERQNAISELLSRFNHKDDWYKLQVANALWVKDGYEIKPEYLEIPLRFAGMTLAEIKPGDYGFVVMYSEFKPLSQSIEIHIEKCDCKSIRGHHSYETLQTIDGTVFAVHDTRSVWPDVNEKFNKHHIRFVHDGFEYEVIGKDFELLKSSIFSKLLDYEDEG